MANRPVVDFTINDILNLIHLVGRHADVLAISSQTDDVHREVIYKAFESLTIATDGESMVSAVLPGTVRLWA